MRDANTAKLFLGLFFFGPFLVIACYETLWSEPQCAEACAPHPPKIVGGECFCDRSLEKPE